MSYAPCLNPACKSYGQPHPFCKCHGGMAKGGEVGACNGPHQPDCEYFAEGGAVSFDNLKEDAPSSPPQMFDDLKEDAPTQGGGDFDSLVDDSQKYSTTGHQIGTAVEGAAQGVLGPLAPLIETQVLGIPKEDIVGRQNANPWTHGIAETAGLAGSMLVGTGEAALAAKAAEAVAKTAELGKLGSAVIKGAISNGIIQGGDEVSKWMLGQGDPQESVGAKLAHVGAAGLFGGLMGGGGKLAAGAAKQGLKEIADKQFGQKAEYFLNGVASVVNPVEEEPILSGVSKKAYLDGQKFFKAVTNHASSAAALTEGFRGYKEDGATGALKGAASGYLEGLIFKKGVKALTPAMVKILSSGNLTGSLQALDHAAEIAKGAKAVESGIEHLFSGVGGAGQQAINAYSSERDRKKLEDYIANGGIDQNVQAQIYKSQEAPAFAEGGEVAPSATASDGVEIHYPEQSLLLNVARGRVSNYLNSLRPSTDQAKLAFDAAPDTSEQEKSYQKALDIAENPLSILGEIKKGTIEPDHIKHLNALYPEVSGLLQKKITERIVRSQLDGERPPSSVRQGLSMFMGTPLSGEFLPQNIQAAQAVFMQNKPQPDAPPPSGGGSKAKLSKSDQSFLTGGQALQKRAQKV